MPVLSKAQVAAVFLSRLSAKLGLPEPECAKSTMSLDKLAPVSDDLKVQVELAILIADLSDEMRSKVLAEMPRLALWYELYTEYEGDTLCAELTSHMDRPASKLRLEHAAKRSRLAGQA